MNCKPYKEKCKKCNNEIVIRGDNYFAADLTDANVVKAIYVCDKCGEHLHTKLSYDFLDVIQEPIG